MYNMISRSIISISIILFLVTAFSCSKKTGPEIEDVLMVIYTSKSSTVTRGTKEMPLSPGLLLKKGDIIKTGNGTVDIQSRSGSIIRIRNFSNMTVDSLLKSPAQKTSLTLNEGAMIAKIKKLSSDDEYTVHTPTAIAGVRGTTFSVELQEDNSPKVRVYDGKVSVKPKIDALENSTEETVANNPSLQELKKLQDEQEVILESETEASMSGEVSNIVQKINTEITAESISKSETADVSILKKLSEQNAFEKKEAPVTSKENSEISTLAGVDEELVLKEMEDKADKTEPEINPESSKVILENYNKNLAESLKTIESNSDLKSDEDIKKFYTLVEEVVKKDGQKQTGAVVTQIGDKLIFHSSEGVNQIQTDDVDYIDYHLTK